MNYDQLEDEARMGEKTVRSCIQRYTKDVGNIFIQRFLNWLPTKVELQEIVNQSEYAGFSDCFVAIDCVKMHRKTVLLLTKKSTGSQWKESLPL